MAVHASDVTAHRLPDWTTRIPDAQRAAYVALLRKGWEPARSQIWGVTAFHHGRGESVSASDWLKLLNKACKKDEAARSKAK